MKRWLLSCLLALASMSPAWAHKASDAYLSLSQHGGVLSLRWDVALRDLDAVTSLDSNDDGRLTWGEVQAHQVEIEAYLLSHWTMRAVSANGASDGGNCTFTPERSAQGQALPPQLERRVDGTYYVMNLRADCPSQSGRYEIRYSLMRGVDPTHRGLLKVHGAQTNLISLSPEAGATSLTWVASDAPLVPASAAEPASPQLLDVGRMVGKSPEQKPSTRSAAKPEGTVAGPSEGFNTFVQMWRDGIHHILIGTDHILFLLCLLLPAVLYRPASSAGHRERLRPVAHWHQAMGPVLMTVTMFTLAHSITLVLAALKLVSISPRLIEPAIALTIALAAIDNIHPIFRGRRYLFTFLFGLVHGFGFAGALTEMNLPMSGFVQAVLAFNLGVETGQLLVVLPSMGVLLILRRWTWYTRQVLPAGSMLALLVAAGWFIERVFDLGFMPI